MSEPPTPHDLPPPTPLAPPRSRKRRPLTIAGAIGLGLVLVWLALRGVDRWLRPDVGNAADLIIGSDADARSSRPDSITAPLDRPIAPGTHPLTPALEVAHAGLDYFRGHVHDYTAVFIKQERVDGELAEVQKAFLKIRQAQSRDGEAIPFSVCMQFLEPAAIAGREVIYVAGRNDGRLVAHEGGLLGLATVWLQPTSALAMRGNRYPITEIGIETMIRRMIEKGERDAQFGDCEVRVDRSRTVEGHAATQIEIRHPRRGPSFDFHVARILIDDQLNVPVSYESYDWPPEPDAPPALLERYQYADLQLNVGLAESDFDPANKSYHFRWVGNPP